MARPCRAAGPAAATAACGKQGPARREVTEAQFRVTGAVRTVTCQWVCHFEFRVVPVTPDCDPPGRPRPGRGGRHGQQPPVVPLNLNLNNSAHRLTSDSAWLSLPADRTQFGRSVELRHAARH